MANVLLVCTANICRSPVAEAILKDRLVEQGLDGWQVSSAGTWAYPGQLAANFSVSLMAEQGLDIQGHSSRVIDDDLLEENDLVLCMERGHVEALQAEFPEHRFKIYLLTEMSGKLYSVSDPYGGPLELYEEMVAEVTTLIEEGLPRIVELASRHEQARLSDETNL